MRVLQVPLQDFIFSECLCFSPKLLIVWKIFFSSFSLDCKQKIWMVGHQVRLRGDHNFSSWQKKKEQEIFRSRRWACIFRVKWYTVGMHNAMKWPWNKFLMRHFTRKGKSSIATMNLLSPKIWSNFFFHVCYHAGGSTKHLGQPKVRRRDEESSPSDFTPEKRKTCLAGKTRTYLWACPLTPTPRPHFSSPCLCKIKMRGSSKMAWIDAVRTIR